jgi:hypothetical protein
LLIAVSAERGVDPVELVVEQVKRCFQGDLPLSFAQHLLEEWTWSGFRKELRARLRLRLCEQAFESGFEVRNLLDAGQTAPALGAVLGCSAPRKLAALRLVWSQRSSGSWWRLGKVQTAFELATPKRERELGEYPDVVLWQENPDFPIRSSAEESGSNSKFQSARIAMTTSGVWLQGELFTSQPRIVEVRTRKRNGELRLGDRRFVGECDMEALARHMERWFRYTFHEFLPQLSKVEAWQSADRSALLKVWGAVGCPECGRFMLPQVGDLGLPVDEGEGRE